MSTYTFVEAYKAMKDEGSYARCCGYPFIFMIRKEESYRIYVSEDEGDSFGYLQDFNLWMALCTDHSWVISDDGLSWYSRKGERCDWF